MSEEAERLYERARALEPEARTAFVEEACHGDPRLREELVLLLEQAEAAEEFFELLSDAVFSAPFSTGEGEGRADSRGLEPATPSRHLEPNIGRTIGHYRILARIGAGGMGTVYRAHDTRLNREVALKFLPPHLSAQLDAEERLLLEARAAASLEHPNVCTIYEIGETDEGRPFIAMALCEGETLKERLRQGPFSPVEAVEIAMQIARGLAAAHARGIVHRDVKPGNVMLTGDRTAKLLDFGLAKVTDVTLTRPGMTPGTMAYMSPEQARGDPVDQRTDLWSLGVVLYEMLTGVRPFRGGNDRALLQAILHEDPEPVTTRRPEVPVFLERIVERLLQKDPEARYSGARELLADLERGVAPAGRPPRLALVAKRRPALLAGTTAALLSLAGIAAWLAGRGEESAPAATVQGAEKPSIAVLPLSNLSTDPNDAVLADGMTEELIAMLAKTGDLRVIARTSAFAFRDRQTDVRSIADSLRVSNILEGGVQKIGSRLRVQVRLVDARDGSTRWSETYDREIGDVFAVQEEIAQAVARELGARLGGRASPVASRHTQNVAAYELYLRGNDTANLRSDSGPHKALEYFRQAVALDSTYAAAYAGMSRMYGRMRSTEDPGMPDRDLQALSLQAALKAVALDDSVAEGHAALGLVRMHVQRDYRSAEIEFKRAIELDPMQGLTREWLALLYLRTGRPVEALAETRRSLEIDPLSPTAHAEVAHALIANGRYDEALAHLSHIQNVQPPLLRTAQIAAQAYAMKEMWEEAIAAIRPQAERDLAAASSTSQSAALYGYLLARSGRREEADRVLQTLLARSQRTGTGAFDVVAVYAGLGDFDQAFAWLDQAIDDRSVRPTHFSIMSPLFEDLRRDPRFERVKSRLGIQNR